MLLSVIIPVYKVEQYLPQCIESILAQTVSDLELILVDDGSPDGSGKICDDYASRFSNIRVIHKENGGHTSARKAGLRIAEGKYISFIDSDDFLEPDMYEKMIRKLQEHQADIVITGHVMDYSDRTVMCENALHSGVYTGSSLEDLRCNALFSISKAKAGITGAMWCKLFPREMILEPFLNQEEDLRVGEDALFSFRMLLDARCVVIDNENRGYHYRILENSIVHSFDKKYFTNIQTMHNRLLSVVSENPTDAIRRSFAYNYVFLFANGISLVMSRRNRISYWAKYQMVKQQLDDPLLKQSLELVELERFPQQTAAQLRLLAAHRPGAFVAHYLLSAVAGRVAARLKR